MIEMSKNSLYDVIDEINNIDEIEYTSDDELNVNFNNTPSDHMNNSDISINTTTKIIKLKVVYQTISKSLIGQVPNPNGPFIDACNGYKRSALDGTTVVFFKKLPDGIYNIVICELNESKLNRYGISYNDLLTQKYDFVF